MLINNQLDVNIESKFILKKKHRGNGQEGMESHKNQKGRVQQPILFSLN